MKMILPYLREGERTSPPAFLRLPVATVSVALALFILWIGSFGAINPYTYASVYLSVILALTFVFIRARKGLVRMGWGDGLLSLASVIVGVYLLANNDHILDWVSGLTEVTPADLAIGLILVFLIVEATRRAVGPGLLGVVLVLLAYIAWGEAITGPFGHSGVPVDRFVEQAVYSTNAIFGDPVQIAASYAFLFVLFGHLFHRAGGGDFFFQIAAALAGKRPGGPAKVAVIGSGLFGTVSGSPTSDVLTTGSVTIPLMKRLGYRPAFAGAVEAVASTGGSIMPPVMGSAAFLMAEFTGLRYVEIAEASILVGLLYYFGVYAQVHMHSLRMNLPPLPREQIIGLWLTLKSGWLYLIPLGLIIGVLLEGYTPTYAAVAGTLSTILISWFIPGHRLGPSALVKSCVDVTIAVLPLTAAVAAGGLVMGGILMTGFAGKFGSMVMVLSQGSVFVSLVLAMLLSIVLGMGMPTPSVYIMTAALLGPTLIDLGIDLLPGHLFLVYFAALSAITPPVAVAAFAAASIADAPPMRIGWLAVRLGIAAFIVPFLFVYHPELLLRGDPLQIVIALAGAAIGLYFLSVGLEAWLIGHCSMPVRLLAALAGLMMMVPEVTTDIAGFGLALGVLAWQLGRRRRDATARQPG